MGVIALKVFYVSCSNLQYACYSHPVVKSSKMAENNSKWPIIVIFHIYVHNFTLWARFTFRSLSCILLKFVGLLHAANNQLSDNFNNGGGLLSSVLLFQMILTMIRGRDLFPSPTGLVNLFYQLIIGNEMTV